MAAEPVASLFGIDAPSFVDVENDSRALRVGGPDAIAGAFCKKPGPEVDHFWGT